MLEDADWATSGYVASSRNHHESQESLCHLLGHVDGSCYVSWAKCPISSPNPNKAIAANALLCILLYGISVSLKSLGIKLQTLLWNPYKKIPDSHKVTRKQMTFLILPTSSLWNVPSFKSYSFSLLPSRRQINNCQIQVYPVKKLYFP
jgi:hypothetical protein